MQSKISVIVPVYNTKKYLEKCIGSIASQTLREIEIILVDDGSNDGSSIMCESLAYADKRIRVIHQSNHGQTVARQKGLNQASSEYVCFVDSDDWIEKNYCEDILRQAVENKADMVLCDHYIDDNVKSRYFKNGVREGFYDRNRISKEILPNVISDGSFYKWNIYPSLCNRLLKKDKLKEIQEKVDTSIIMGEDAAVSIPYVARCDSMVVVKKAYYHYYQHLDSTLRKTQSENDKIQYKKLYNWLQANLSGCISGEILEKQLRDYMLFIAGPRVMRLSEQYAGNEELFPFDGVRRGTRVIIYGAGIFGLNMYKYLEETNFCKLVAVVDRDFVRYRNEGFNVISPDEMQRISNDEYDFIIITVMDKETQTAIEDNLRGKGMDKTKIKRVNWNSFRKWLMDEVLGKV